MGRWKGQMGQRSGTTHLEELGGTPVNAYSLSLVEIRLSVSL
jgi:hypothetical protein